MLDLATQERLTYESMWQIEDYAKTSPGSQLVPAFLEMSGAQARTYPTLKLGAPHTTTVLDAGCGSGKGALALHQAGFRVEMCDLTDAGLVDEAKAIPFWQACLWAPQIVPKRFDWVYCCDVLEHIPTPFVMLAVSRLLQVARNGVFLSIALQGDNFGVWVGKPLHQTVYGFVQWRDLLSTIGHVKECRDMLMNGVYLVEPR
jgi:SAM-dependent methyltransferase